MNDICFSKDDICFSLPAGKKAPPPTGWRELRESLPIPEGANRAVMLQPGQLVLDEDPRNGGDLTLLELIGDLPRTRCVLTPSGGKHLYFRYDPALRIPNRPLTTGIDVKTHGGYVLVPPSRTAVGKYELFEDAPIADVPDWLLALLTERAPAEPVEALDSITDDQLADLRSAMRHPAFVETLAGNSAWSGVGYALLSLGEVGRELWLEFCPQWPNFETGADERWWHDHARETPRSDFRSIFKRATKCGWLNPITQRASSPDDFDVIAGTPSEAAEADQTRATSPWDSPVYAKDLLGFKPNPIAWFVRERIPAGRGILLTGIGGSSKTTTLIQVAIAGCIGRISWDWSIDRTGKVVLVLTEDTRDDAHNAVYAIAEVMRLSDEERALLAERLILYPLAGEDMRLLVKGHDGTLVKSHHFYSLVKRINELGDVVMVGLDPALSLTDGDEGEQTHQRMLGKTADDLGVLTGAAVVLVSHATKASANAEELSSHNSRGGGAITDAARGEYAIRTMTAKEARQAGIEDTEERKRHKQIVCTKGNRIPPSGFVPIWLRAGHAGVLEQVAVHLDTAPTRGKAGKGTVQRKAMRVLADLYAKHHASVASGRDGTDARVALADWRAAMKEAGIDRRRLKDLVESLEHAGVIRVDGRFVEIEEDTQ